MATEMRDVILATLTGAILAVGGVAIGGVLTSVVIEITRETFPSFLAVAGSEVFITVVALQGIAMPGLSLLYLTARPPDSPSLLQVSLPNLRDGLWIAGVFVGLVAVWVSVTLVFEHFGIETAQNAIIQSYQNTPWVFLVLAVLSVLFVGPGEEILFRGVIQGRLREVYSGPVAIFITSVFFAFPHLISYQGSGVPVTIGVIFVLSIVLGYGYEVRDTLFVPALAHGLFNATQYLVVYVYGTNIGV